MTFIYRQLLGVCNNYRPIVLTNKVENLKAFPFPDVHLKQKSLLDRIVSNFFYFFTNNFKPIPPSHIPYWEKIIKEHNLRLIHAHFG
ncbi:MAG: hypothetical protein ACE5FU_04750, partial [Nitrospinota bacterium]